MQSKATKEQANSLTNTNKAQGSIDVDLDKTKVDKAVEEAKKQGLKTKQTEIKDLGTTKSKEETERKQKEVEELYMQRLV